MLWYLKLAVLLATPTAIRGRRTYYPVGCDSRSVEGTEYCVLTCKGKDACEDRVQVPSWSALKNFVVRCIDERACNDLELRDTRGSVENYLMCIGKRSCDSVEKARDSSSFVYCEGEKDSCERISNKRVQETTTKNGVSVVIFDNNVAVGRSSSATGADTGIISDPNGPSLPHYHFKTHFTCTLSYAYRSDIRLIH